MTPARDPSDMTADQRLQEVAELLGKAYLRLRAGRAESRIPLEDTAQLEAPCGQPVNAAETAPAKEPA